MLKPEKCGCEQSLAAEQTIKDLNGEIILRDARIRVLEATAREGMERIEKNFRLEKLVEDIKRVMSTWRFEVKQIQRIEELITDYQKERNL